MAIPCPLSRPALLRISERERCPKIIAKIDKGNAKRKTPQARLAMAVVSGGIPVAVAAATGADTSFPQTLQNLSPAATLFPQPEQNKRLTSESRRCKLMSRRIFYRTVLLPRRRVNSLDGFSPGLP